MEKQVLSIEQMQELIKLDIDISTASMCWIGCSDGNDVYPYNKTFRKCFEEHLDTIPLVLTPTFTLQDILEIIPSFDLSKTSIVDPIVGIRCFKGYEEIKFASKQSLLDAAFSMLKWCKQKNYI